MPTMDDHHLDIEREAQKDLPALTWEGTEGNESEIYCKRRLF